MIACPASEDSGDPAGCPHIGAGCLGAAGLAARPREPFSATPEPEPKMLQIIDTAGRNFMTSSSEAGYSSSGSSAWLLVRGIAGAIWRRGRSEAERRAGREVLYD